ncbi:MAG: iron-sulfur cluster assembly scaffold protein [Pyrinomonadaceae bacterium]|nr:iron-sulfur cluster assembly scaffold protein [Pyrinomonadaceae bacterium]
MPYYKGSVREHFLRPRNVGEVERTAAVGDAGSFICGAALRLTLEIDAEARAITDAKFKAAGCGYLIAAASVLTETIKGIAISEAATLAESSSFENRIIEYLADVPPDKLQCVALCREALLSALANYHNATREEWTGEEALICTCFGVSEKSIEQAIRTNGLRTIEQVTRACNAGGGCHSCHPLIEDILEDYWRTEATESSDSRL